MGLLDIFSKIKDIGSKVVKGISDMRNIKNKMAGIIGHFTKPFGPSVKPSDKKMPDENHKKIAEKLNVKGELSQNADKLKNFKMPPPGIKPITPEQREAFKKMFKH